MTIVFSKQIANLNIKGATICLNICFVCCHSYISLWKLSYLTVHFMNDCPSKFMDALKICKMVPRCPQRLPGDECTRESRLSLCLAYVDGERH